MEQYVIEGQTKLRGMLPVHGAKNAALPILAGTLLVPGVCEIHNCPALSDVAVPPWWWLHWLLPVFPPSAKFIILPAAMRTCRPYSLG